MCRPYRSREIIFAIIKQQKSNQFQNANYIDVSFGILIRLLDSMIVAAKEAGCDVHVGCFAHTLNMA